MRKAQWRWMAAWALLAVIGGWAIQVPAQQPAYPARAIDIFTPVREEYR